MQAKITQEQKDLEAEELTFHPQIKRIEGVSWLREFALQMSVNLAHGSRCH